MANKDELTSQMDLELLELLLYPLCPDWPYWVVNDYPQEMLQISCKRILPILPILSGSLAERFRLPTHVKQSDIHALFAGVKTREDELLVETLQSAVSFMKKATTPEMVSTAANSSFQPGMEAIQELSRKRLWMLSQQSKDDILRDYLLTNKVMADSDMDYMMEVDRLTAAAPFDQKPQTNPQPNFAKQPVKVQWKETKSLGDFANQLGLRPVIALKSAKPMQNFKVILKNMKDLPSDNIDNLLKGLSAKLQTDTTYGIHADETNCKPGYLQLFATKPDNFPEMAIEFQEDKELNRWYLALNPEKIAKGLFNLTQKTPWLSNLRSTVTQQLFKQDPNVSHEYTVPHGPSTMFASRLTESQGSLTYDVDSVVAIPCKFWPPVASGWVTRERPSGWPSKETIDKVASEGCHAVKNPHPTTNHPDTEFRYSFSVPERELAHTVTDQQRLAYKLFKLFRKILLEPVEGKEEKELSSYYLKTTFFWTLEKVSHDNFSHPTYGKTQCFLKLIDALIIHLEEKCLPHYFIPEINLLDDFKDEQIQKYLSVAKQVQNDPMIFVQRFNESFLPAWSVPVKTCEGREVPVYDFNQIFAPVLNKTFTTLEEVQEGREECLQNLLEFLIEICCFDGLVSVVKEMSHLTDPDQEEISRKLSASFLKYFFKNGPTENMKYCQRALVEFYKVDFHLPLKFYKMGAKFSKQISGFLSKMSTSKKEDFSWKVTDDFAQTFFKLAGLEMNKKEYISLRKFCETSGAVEKKVVKRSNYK